MVRKLVAPLNAIIIIILIMKSKVGGGGDGENTMV